MRRLLVAAFCVMLSVSALALPSIEDVQSEVRQGRWTHAEEMMREVVAAKPASARAHYVYAEILAHDGRFDRAREEAAQARRLDPAIKFTDAAKFSAFERLLEREQTAAQRPAASTPAPALSAGPMVAPATPASSGLPGWVWALGLALVAWLGWRMFAARRAVAPAAAGGWSAMPQGGGVMGAAPGMGPAPGMGGGYGMGAPAAGSGLLGTGLAVAGGVAAGMLAEKLLSDHHGSSSAAPGLAGMAPGSFDTSALADPALRELEQRPVDFGQGDGWDGGGGTLDAGSGSDDGW
jgi:hypothetical protein